MADHSSLIERPLSASISGARSLDDIDAELTELASSLPSSWRAPSPLRLSLADATAALDELARRVTPATPIAAPSPGSRHSDEQNAAHPHGEPPSEPERSVSLEVERAIEAERVADEVAAAPEVTLARMSVVDASFETIDIPDLPHELPFEFVSGGAAPEPVVEAVPEPVVAVAPEPVVEAPPVVEPAPEPGVEAAPEPVAARVEAIAIEEALTRETPVESATQTTLDLPDLMEFGPLDDVLTDPLATVIDASTAATTAPIVEEPKTPAVEAAPAPSPAPRETSIEEALALIDEEPEFETAFPAPASLVPPEPARSTAETSALASIIIAGEAEVSIDTDDVLIESAPQSAAPAATQSALPAAPPPAPVKAPSIVAPVMSSRPSDIDLGELTFEMEPDLGLGAPEPSVVPPRLTLSSIGPRVAPPSVPSKPPPRAAPRSLPPTENLELDLAELLSEGKPPSVKPPPPLLRPPPPVRSAPPPPPPVPRVAKPVEEPDIVELIDEDAIEVVKASSAPPPPLDGHIPAPPKTH